MNDEDRKRQGGASANRQAHEAANSLARAPRLFVAEDLSVHRQFEAAPEHANYLVNVMRLKAGAAVRLFNGRDGEWLGAIAQTGKRLCLLSVLELLRPQAGGPDIDYLFAPIKKARLDYMVQKAVEMGVARLRPVLTRFTQAERINLERMRANAIEAAEQCGVLRVPEISSPEKLDAVLANWDHGRALIFCDEAAPEQGPLSALEKRAIGPIAVLIGPEGGFAEAERAFLLSQTFVTAISLGPRILRADTAAVAALALVNAVRGE